MESDNRLYSLSNVKYWLTTAESFVRSHIYLKRKLHLHVTANTHRIKETLYAKYVWHICYAIPNMYLKKK